jgi:hypothetical protein
MPFANATNVFGGLVWGWAILTHGSL